MAPENTPAVLANCEKFAKLLAGKVLGLAKRERLPEAPLGRVRSLEGVTGGRALVMSEKISSLASKSVVVLILGIVPPNRSKVMVGWVKGGKGAEEGSALEKLVNSSSSSSLPAAVRYDACTVTAGSWCEGCGGVACTNEEKLSSTSP